jgi:TPR repeat protein
MTIQSMIIDANNGDSNAMVALGAYYEDIKDYDNMKKYYLMAVEKNNWDALVDLGYYYQMIKDYDNMIKYYFLALDKAKSLTHKGLVIAYLCKYHREAGEEHYKKENYDAAYIYFKEGYKWNDPKCTFNIAHCYSFGHGIEKNLKKATIYYNLAVSLGEVKAYNNLGIHYQFGIGCNKDNEKAYKNYKLAAENNILEGMYNLGVCYQKGIGTNINLFEAVKWWSEAASKNNIRAIKKLLKYYLSIEDEEMVDKLKQQMTKLNDVDLLEVNLTSKLLNKN